MVAGALRRKPREEGEDMRTMSLAVAGALALVAVFVSASLPVLSGSSESSDREGFEFENLVGVQSPFTGAANPIRGVNGGGVAWTLARGEAELDENGVLRVEVERLVLAAGGSAGSNPFSTFRAILSCLTAGTTTPVNLVTAPFAVTTGVGGGTGETEQQLNVPSPCFAPIVFVTNPVGTAWFAISGL